VSGNGSEFGCGHPMLELGYTAVGIDESDMPKSTCFSASVPVFPLEGAGAVTAIAGWPGADAGVETYMVDDSMTSSSNTQRDCLLPVNSVVPYPMSGQSFESIPRYLYVVGVQLRRQDNHSLERIRCAIKSDIFPFSIQTQSFLAESSPFRIAKMDEMH